MDFKITFLLSLFSFCLSGQSEIHIEGELELSSSEGWIRYNDITGNNSNEYYQLHDNGDFFIARGLPTLGRNFRMSGANLYLGEAFAGGGSFLRVGVSGDGSTALANSWSLFSDKKLKNGIQSLENCLAIDN